MHIQRLAVLVMVAALPAFSFGHHGTSVSYEMDKTITVTGTVMEFDLAYPHPTLFLDVKDEAGQTVEWGVEFLPTPAVLRNLGWTRETIKAGDTVVIGCHPSKSGAPVCALQTLTLNGEAMPLGPGAPGGARPGQRRP